jgi:hypothetical protein
MAELKQQFQTINLETTNTIKQTELCIKVTIKTIEKLKTFFNNYNFKNRFEEIEFFKNIKPVFAAKLIYFNEIYNIEIAKPSGSKKAIKKHYNNHLQKLKLFHKENIEFYKYYRAGNDSLDRKYFLRGKHDIKLTLDSFYFQSDYSFATSHDYKVAKIIANDEIQSFLNANLKSLKQPISTDKKLKWSASKAALVELLYALDTVGVFNEGKSSLNETAAALQSFFNIELGQFNRTYLEIRNRKAIEKTHFLDTLKENLIKRIESADER